MGTPPEANTPRRVCPICDLATADPVCPDDRTATLLVDLPPSEAAPPAEGMVIGDRYEITKRIGAGGYGQVFEARHRGTGQNLALKILRPPHDGDHAFATKRFFLEARVTSGLAHPNTVRVFDFGQEDSGLLFIAMELLTGRTLRAEMKTRKSKGGVYEEAEAIEIAIQVTRSLSEAHDAGLVHRDLKPDNIFLHRAAADDVVVKVLDFGIVKLGGGHATLSSDTSVPGTPAYMAPEHALNRPVDARTDLYSLGVILYQLVTGELPFVGGSDPQTLYMHAFEPLPSLAAKSKTTLSPNFVQIIQRTLAKQPEHRFKSARVLRDALAACIEGRPYEFTSAPAASSEAPTELEVSPMMSTPVAGTGLVPTVTSRRPWGRVAMVLGTLAVMAVVAFAVSTVLLREEPAPRPSLSPPVPPPPVVEVPPPAEAPKVKTPPETPAPEVAPVPTKPAEKAPPKRRRRVRRRTKPTPAKKVEPKKKVRDPLLDMRLEDLVEEGSSP